jgi:hypothetical protein
VDYTSLKGLLLLKRRITIFASHSTTMSDVCQLLDKCRSGGRNLNDIKDAGKHTFFSECPNGAAGRIRCCHKAFDQDLRILAQPVDFSP